MEDEMILKEISYSLGRTLQLSAYEPVNYHASVKAEVSENEDIDKAYDVLRKIVQDQIRQDFDRVRPSQTPTEKFVKEIKAIKSVKELGEYYKKNKDKHKSVEFNKCVANRKVEIHEGI